MSENEYLVESEELFQGWSQNEPVNGLECAGLSLDYSFDVLNSKAI